MFWGRLFDLGIFRVLLAFSSALLIIATFLTGECKQYWQFFLCQGIAIGIGSGGVFGPTLAVVAHWCMNALLPCIIKHSLNPPS